MGEREKGGEGRRERGGENWKLEVEDEQHQEKGVEMRAGR